MIVDSTLIQQVANEASALLQSSILSEVHIPENEFFIRFVLLLTKCVTGYVNQLFLMEIERLVNIALPWIAEED